MRDKLSRNNSLRGVMGFLIVFLGGGLGSALRYGVGVLATRLLGVGFPVGTLFINVLGSFAMGAVVKYFALHGQLPESMRLLLTTGIIGGFTTFSTFSLEAVLLYQRGEPGLAVLYVAASVLLGLGALILAMVLIK